MGSVARPSCCQRESQFCMTTRRLLRYERMSSKAKSHRAGVPCPPCAGVLINENGIHSGAPERAGGGGI